MSEDQTKDATPALPSVADLTLGEGGSGGSVDGGANEPGDRGPSSAASERVPAIVKVPPPAPPPPSAPPSSSEEGAEDASSAPAATDKSKNAGKEPAAPKELTPEQRDKILTQVEFYFSDANLPTDAFLMKKVKSNPDGWVPLAVIVGFNRMKQLLKKNTHRVVAEILTEKSEALVVNDEGTHVRRANPLPTFDLEDVQSRTIVAENFSKNMGGGGGGGDGHVMAIERARHPVVERLLPAGAFVPNCVRLGGAPDLLVLTGPNAGGKSVYLRTLGVLQIMAQAGSFVPADAATLSVADRLFTRVGAVDDIGGGQSTFTVEMRETAEILRHATGASLVLLDEVGRGTAAADGVAIARAVAEHLAGTVRCRALFATHLHELSALAGALPNVGAAQMGALPRARADGGEADDGEGVQLTYRLLPGAATSSYGLHAARVAGFPPSVLRRASELLRASAGPGERQS